MTSKLLGHALGRLRGRGSPRHLQQHLVFLTGGTPDLSSTADIPAAHSSRGFKLKYDPHQKLTLPQHFGHLPDIHLPLVIQCLQHALPTSNQVLRLSRQYSIAPNGAPPKEEAAGEAGKQAAASSLHHAAPPASPLAYGWSRKEVMNLPNAISMARLISGPAISVLIVQGHHGAALTAVAVAGLSDWLDGYAARLLNLKSSLGSYLDPLADKVLIGCVGLAMAATGMLPGPLLVVVVGRDVVLVAASFWMRARALGWKWTSAAHFFQIGGEGRVPKMEPLFISKANTVGQLALVGLVLGSHAVGWEATGLITNLSWIVGATTILSGAAYFRLYARQLA